MTSRGIDLCQTQNPAKLARVVCGMSSMAILWQMAIFQLELFWQENVSIILKEPNMQVHKI